jgi:hypothetical protein
LDDELELGALLVVAEGIALDGGGKAALAGQAQLVEGDVLGGGVDAALEVVGVFQLATLGRDQPQHDHLAGRDEPQRLETAGALVVVFQEESVHGQAAEQRLGDEVVAARGGPGGAEVAAAQMRGDGQPGRLVGQRRVDLADVAQVHVVGVLAAGGDLGPLGRVVEVGQGRVVELQVGAALIGEPGHLVGVGCGQVGPEPLDVGIDLRVDRGGAAAVVDHVRRGDGQLGGHPRGCHRLQVAEILTEDRFVHPQLAAHVQGGRSPLDVACRVVELHRQMARRLADPADLIDEVHVPGGAAELPVGHRPQPHVPLHRHHIGDRRVLHLAQPCAIDLPRREVVPGRQQAGRAQQTTHMVGTERRRRTHGQYRGVSAPGWSIRPGRDARPASRWDAGQRLRVQALLPGHLAQQADQLRPLATGQPREPQHDRRSDRHPCCRE